MYSTFNLFLAPEEVDGLLDNALIAFDTSALLELYYYSKATQSEILEKIFGHLSGRLWLPGQVWQEFQKNCKIVAQKPRYSYQQLLEGDRSKGGERPFTTIKDTAKSFAQKDLKEIQNQFQTLRERTSRQDKHPWLPPGVYADLDAGLQQMQEQIQQFQGSVDTFSEKFKQAIDDQVQLLEEEDDAIAARIGEVFDIGEEYSFDRMMEIASEGAFRYQEQIPPGYMDAKEKIGLAKYGDLFLWKQILDKAASTGQDLLLVINDIKPDWQDKQTEMPRTELLQEYASASDRRFWTLTLKDFIYRINGRLQSQMPEEVLKEIEQSNTDVPEARDFFTGDLWRDRVQELLFEEDGMVQIVSEITGEEWDSSDTFRVFEGIHAQGGRVAVILMITEGMMQQRHARAAMYGAFNLRRILMEKHLTYQYRFICVCEDDINAARAGAYSRTLTENAMPDEGVMWCDFGYVNGKGSITVVEVNHAMG